MILNQRYRHVCNSQPTLFVAECVLIYLPPEATTALLAALASHFPLCSVINYEQIARNKAFVATMTANLKRRGCELAGLDAVPSLSAQVQRFKACGFPHTEAKDMIDVYNLIPDESRRR